MDIFKNACRIHTSMMVARYLMSNAEGRWDGAEKAQRHRELCQFYVAAVRGVSDPESVPVDFYDEYVRVHDHTQQLTDNLDIEIGFPEKGRPDYERLEPKFFERFHALALEALGVELELPTTQQLRS